jgi:hypothetical protein
MQKTAPYIIAIILVIAAIGVLVTRDQSVTINEQPDPMTEQGTTATVSGTVTDVDTSPWAFDGNAIVMIETDQGDSVEIQIPARINLCPAQSAIATNLAVGEMVEVSGNMFEGAIVPCQSTDDYLRVIEDNVPTEQQPTTPETSTTTPGNPDSNPDVITAQPATQNEVTGTVIGKDFSPWAYDGDGIVTVRTDSGAIVNVEFPAEATINCVAYPNTTRPNVGDRIEAKGLIQDGNIRPCESEDHYIRVIDSE